jgi:dihydroflavonol-4-reductase
MRVLITGANGFVGSWLARSLSQKGCDLRILHRANSDLSPLADLKFESALGDVTDIESLHTACRKIDSVFHLAGVVGYSKAQRAIMDRVNVGGTDNVVKACLRNSVRRLVHMSSVTAIGASFDGAVPLNENSPYNLAHLNLGYFETKRISEGIVKSAVTNDGLDAVILNPSTIYGPGDARKGSRSTQLKVARGRFPFYTSGGVSIVAVEDAVSGIISAWKVGRTGERYILSGENVSIRQLFTIIAKHAGVRRPPFYLPRPIVRSIGFFGDVMESFGKSSSINSENYWTSRLFHWFDSTKAQSELEFKPRSADMAIGSSVEWMKQNGLLNL